MNPKWLPPFLTILPLNACKLTYYLKITNQNCLAFSGDVCRGRLCPALACMIAHIKRRPWSVSGSVSLLLIQCLLRMSRPSLILNIMILFLLLLLFFLRRVYFPRTIICSWIWSFVINKVSTYLPTNQSISIEKWTLRYVRCRSFFGMIKFHSRMKPIIEGKFNHFTDTGSFE